MGGGHPAPSNRIDYEKGPAGISAGLTAILKGVAKVPSETG
jgi:hypothetical protein